MSLAPYSEDRIAQALWDLSSNVFGDLGRAPEDWDLHLRVFNSFEVLFCGFFAVRCKPVLGHMSEGSELDGICYMWWDLVWDFGSSAIPDSSFLPMLRSILTIDHAACQESALHGLAHIVRDREGQSEVEAIIDDFLRREPRLRPELREYALSARTGMVQ